MAKNLVHMLALKELTTVCLRENIGDEQSKLLEDSFQTYQREKAWMRARTLHLKYGGRSEAVALLNGMCGSIIWEVEDHQVGSRYQLRPLGYFATAEGWCFEQILLNYLSYLHQRVREDPDIQRIKSEDLQGSLLLNENLIKILGILVHDGHFYGRNFSNSPGDSWEADLPEDVEDIPENPWDYMQKKLFQDFDPEMPVTRVAISEYFKNRRSPLVGFHFGTSLSQPLSIAQTYVNLERIRKLKELKNAKFDFKKLVRLCEELNEASRAGSYFSMVFILRSILDHVPPIFNQPNFAAVAANFTGGRSVKITITKLDAFLRNIADLHLHEQIQKSENLPNAQQVDFAPALDVLLSEVIRITLDSDRGD